MTSRDRCTRQVVIHKLVGICNQQLEFIELLVHSRKDCRHRKRDHTLRLFDITDKPPLLQGSRPKYQQNLNSLVILLCGCTQECVSLHNKSSKTVDWRLDLTRHYTTLRHLNGPLPRPALWYLKHLESKQCTFDALKARQHWRFRQL